MVNWIVGGSSFEMGGYSNRMTPISEATFASVSETHVVVATLDAAGNATTVASLDHATTGIHDDFPDFVMLKTGENRWVAYGDVFFIGFVFDPDLLTISHASIAPLSAALQGTDKPVARYDATLDMGVAIHDVSGSVDMSVCFVQWRTGDSVPSYTEYRVSQGRVSGFDEMVEADVVDGVAYVLTQGTGETWRIYEVDQTGVQGFTEVPLANLGVKADLGQQSLQVRNGKIYFCGYMEDNRPGGDLLQAMAELEFDGTVTILRGPQVDEPAPDFPLDEGPPHEFTHISWLLPTPHGSVFYDGYYYPYPIVDIESDKRIHTLRSSSDINWDLYVYDDEPMQEDPVWVDNVAWYPFIYDDYAIDSAMILFFGVEELPPFTFGTGARTRRFSFE